VSRLKLLAVVANKVFNVFVELYNLVECNVTLRNDLFYVARVFGINQLKFEFLSNRLNLTNSGLSDGFNFPRAVDLHLIKLFILLVDKFLKVVDLISEGVDLAVLADYQLLVISDQFFTAFAISSIAFYLLYQCLLLFDEDVDARFMVGDLAYKIFTLDSPLLLVVLVDLLKSLFNFRVKVLNLFENAGLNIAILVVALLGDLVLKGEDNLFLFSESASQSFNFFRSREGAVTSLFLSHEDEFFFFNEEQFLVGQNILFELLEFKVVLSSDLAFELNTLFFAELYLGANVYLLDVLGDYNFLLNNSGHENLHSNKFITELLVGSILNLNQTFFVLN
jgi:hypothetical protein